MQKSQKIKMGDDLTSLKTKLDNCRRLRETLGKGIYQKKDEVKALENQLKNAKEMLEYTKKCYDKNKKEISALWQKIEKIEDKNMGMLEPGEIELKVKDEK